MAAEGECRRRLAWRLAVAGALLSTAFAEAQVTTLDSSGLANHSAVAIGSDGLGLISYYDGAPQDLKVAHCSDVGCTSATLSTMDTAGDVGAWTSIAVGGDGLGLVTYQDVTAGSVKVAHCLDVPCTAAEISVIGAGTPGGVATGADGLGLVAWQTSGSVVVVTHCDNPACSTGTSTSYGPPVVGGGLHPKVAVGPDGLGLVVYQSFFALDYSAVAALHCLNIACTSATASVPIALQGVPPYYEQLVLHPSLAFGGDGRAFFTYRDQVPVLGSASEWIAHCSDPACSAVTVTYAFGGAAYADGSVAAGPDGFGLWATSLDGSDIPLYLLHCQDPGCSGGTASPPLDTNVGQAALAVGQDGLPLMSYSANSALKVAHCPTAACAVETTVRIDDAGVVEGDSGSTSILFTVTLGGASSVPISVDYATADGTATAPADYAPAFGTLSFAPGVTSGIVSVAVVGDTMAEGNETFTVSLSSASNVLIADGQGLGVIVDDEVISISTIDSDGDVGAAPSMTIGGDGLALISYDDVTNGTVKVAHCDDAACASATLTTLGPGSTSVIGTGGDGLGIVAYVEGSGLVRVAHCSDPACSAASFGIVGWGSGHPVGLTVGSDGLAVVGWIAFNPNTGSWELEIDHCSDAACSTSTSTFVGIQGGWPGPVEATTNSLGRALFAFSTTFPFPQIPMSVYVAHCDDVPCSSVGVTTVYQGGAGAPIYSKGRGFGLGADGKPLISYSGNDYSGTFSGTGHCSDDICSTASSGLAGYEPTSMAVDANGKTLLAFLSLSMPGTLQLAECADPACSAAGQVLPFDQVSSGPALRIGQDALPLIAYHYDPTGDLRVAHCPNANCMGPWVSVGDATVVEGDSGTTNAVFTVTLSPATAPVTVDFATADGTATAPADYASASATLSFAPGVTIQTISVPVAGEKLDEADETFSVNLSNASNATIAAGQGLGTIVDDDAPPGISISDGAVVEGDAGTVDASLTVSLSNPSSFQVGVDWQTNAGGGATATPGVDFLVANGSIVFAPGELTRVLAASVLGDSVIEPDEFFFLQLSNSTNSTIADDLGLVTIVDDDAPSLSFNELVHGSGQRQDLAALPGPVADRDYYRLGQSPHSSWEVIVDGASGDVPPLIVERLAADNVTVLQSGTSVSGGSSVSLRWRNDMGFPVANQHLSVRSSGCGALCDASAVYRIRAYETTAHIPRFNNSATQVTVLLLENTGEPPVQGTLWFWDMSGALLSSQGFTLAGQATSVINTAILPGVAGVSGSITVTHDASYGTLSGKAVAVEPGTGFTFDTAMAFRAR